MGAIARSEASEAAQQELAAEMAKALPGDAFVNRVKAALNKNYDEQRYMRFVQMLSTPNVVRLLDLETSDPRPADIQQFLAQVSKQPLPAARIKLIQRIDAAKQSSALRTTTMAASIRAGVLATDECGRAAAKIDKVLAQKHEKMEKASRSSAQVMLAFVYRDVGDAELESYAAVYEDKDVKWLHDIAVAAIEEQFKASAENGARTAKRLIDAHRPKKTMFAPKCEEEAGDGQAEER
jgi:hypothetical protein